MPEALNLIGQKFGHWEVLKHVGGGKVLCQCDCESKTVREVAIKSLRRGTSTSCGCTRKTKIEGKQFGLWLVLEQIDSTYARCKCLKCNKVYEVRVSNLKSGSSTQCGTCARKSVEYKHEDLTGKMFGNWLVLEWVGNGKWKCQCQCEKGTIRNVAAGDLKGGRSTSCGCSLMNNLEGRTFGKLHVLEYIGHGYYNCVCECDNKIVVKHRNALIHGGVTSCGCDTLEKRYNTMYKIYGDMATSKISNPRDIKQQLAVRSKEDLIYFIATNFENKPTIYKLSTSLGISPDRALKLVHKYLLEELVKINEGSSIEDEIKDAIQRITKENILVHDRNVLKPMELDLYIPNKCLAIEVNGIFWHSFNKIGKDKHCVKTLMCAKQNIHLVHVFEHEWKNNKDLIKSIITSYLLDEEPNYNISFLTKEKIHSINSSIQINDNDIVIGYSVNNELLGIVLVSKNGLTYSIKNMYWIKYTKNGIRNITKFIIDNSKCDKLEIELDISKFSFSELIQNKFKVQSMIDPEYTWVHTKSFNTIDKDTAKELTDRIRNKVDDTLVEDKILSELGYLKIYNSGYMQLEWNRVK